MLVTGGKGLLAMDESNPTCNKRFASVGIPETEDARRAYRELILTAPGLDEVGLVPIVEPEVLMDGGHALKRCREVTEEVLRSVFEQLYTQRVALEGMILKPNMVLPGLTCSLRKEVSEVGVGEQQYAVRLIDRQPDELQAVNEVADATVRCLLRTVPAAAPGVAFLSGGQPCELASTRLNAMNARFKSRLPWALVFSFARAIQQPALEIWRGEEANVKAAQRALLHRARCNRAACRGEYGAAMERTQA
jgi:fructose-bisphosphate aldolase class I